MAYDPVGNQNDPMWIRGGEGRYDPGSGSGISQLARGITNEFFPPNGNPHPGAADLSAAVRVIGANLVAQDEAGFNYAAQRTLRPAAAGIYAAGMAAHATDINPVHIRTAQDAARRMDNAFMPLCLTYKVSPSRALMAYHNFIGIKLVNGFAGNAPIGRRNVQLAFPLIYGHSFQFPQLHFPGVPSFAPREGGGRGYKRKKSYGRKSRKRRRY